MRNELLWFLMLLANFGAIMFAYKKFGKIGLYIWIPIATILANIQVVLLVDLFGIGTTLGNILYAGGFLVTDILSENYGEKEAKKAVKLGIFSLIIMVLIMKIAILFIPSNVEEGMKNFESIRLIFNFMPRIAIAGLLAYVFSQFHDVWAYQFWKNKFPEKKYIWIRNNFSTIISQLFDNIIFTLVAFWGIYPINVLLQIFVSTYIIKILVATCDTPFVYLAREWKDKNKVEEIND
ncbi:MAG: queuosine precursor transporter [Fusobacteriaceae bacterium]